MATIFKACEICKKNFETFIKKNFAGNRTCSKDCLKKLRTQIFSGSSNPSYGKTYRSKITHPEWAKNISAGLIRNEVNVGNKNGMKKSENRAKASISAKRKFAEHPEIKETMSANMRKLWADGHYENVRVGRCNWHSYVKHDGAVIKLQGLWELEFAKYLDETRQEFTVHVGRLSYLDENGIERSYYPDFCLADGTYIDVKNPYYEVIHASKIEAVRRANPNITLLIYGKQKLQELGLKLSGVFNAT